MTQDRLDHVTRALEHVGELDRALAHARSAAGGQEPDPALLFFIGRLEWRLGRVDEAAESIDALQTLNPEASVAFVEAKWPISDPASLAHLVEGLRKAGLPE